VLGGRRLYGGPPALKCQIGILPDDQPVAGQGRKPIRGSHGNGVSARRHLTDCREERYEGQPTRGEQDEEHWINLAYTSRPAERDEALGST
jgi:hypothetical protein